MKEKWKKFREAHWKGLAALQGFLFCVATAMVVILCFRYDPLSSSSRRLHRKTQAVLVTCLIGSIVFFHDFIRTVIAHHSERSLAHFRTQYAAEVNDAFADDPAAQRKLLKAVRAYSEAHIPRAVRTLESLRPLCRTPEDTRAVLLFLALCRSESGDHDAAIAAYRVLLEAVPDHPTAMRNLGVLLVRRGEYTEAEALYRRAIECDPNEAVGYYNLAYLCLRRGGTDLSELKRLAKKALSRDKQLYQAASLLTVAAAIEDDIAEQTRWFNRAVNAGENPNELHAMIRCYTTPEKDYSSPAKP